MSKLCGIILGIAVALAIVAGCGSDDADSGEKANGSSVSKESAPTAEGGKNAFAQEAEAICQKGRNRVLRGLSDYQRENGPLGPRDIGYKAVSVAFLPVFRAEVKEIAALTVPAGEEQKVDELLAARRDALEEIERQQLSSNLELAEALKRSDRLMTGYGLESCTFS